jgi:hypothetical protein
MTFSRGFREALHAFVKQVGEKIALLAGEDFLAFREKGQKDVNTGLCS